MKLGRFRKLGRIKKEQFIELAMKQGRFSELGRIKEEQFIELAMKLGRFREVGRIKEEQFIERGRDCYGSGRGSFRTFKWRRSRNY